MTHLGFDRADVTAIGVGGILGASLRWLLTSDADPGTSVGWKTEGFEWSSDTVDAASGIPVDTLLVNLLGCLTLGALTLLLARSVPLPRRLLIGAVTGFCGSLTTFSTFAVEIAERLRGTTGLPPGPTNLAVHVESDQSSALAYVALSLVGGALAFWLGRAGTGRLVEGQGSPSEGSK